MCRQRLGEAGVNYRKDFWGNCRQTTQARKSALRGLNMVPERCPRGGSWKASPSGLFRGASGPGPVACGLTQYPHGLHAGCLFFSSAPENPFVKKLGIKCCLQCC